MHGNAKKTSGGLTKSQLKYNKQGKIVSKKASTLAKKNNRLVKAGYVTRKGVFGTGKMRGGGICSSKSACHYNHIVDERAQNKKTITVSSPIGDTKPYTVRNIASLRIAIKDSTMYTNFLKSITEPTNDINTYADIKLFIVGQEDELTDTHDIEERGKYYMLLGKPVVCDSGLITAIDTGTLDKVHDKLNKVTRVNAGDAEKKDTPLHHAMSHGNIDIVKELLNIGADVKAVNQDGDTPLHVASAFGHEAVAALLLDQESGRLADMKAVNKDGDTPLHLASGYGQGAVVKVLLEHGADVEVVNEEKQTPLHSAAVNGHSGWVIELLLDEESGRCADVNAADEDGDTPLHIASHLGHHAVAKQLLLIHEVDVDVRNNADKTPLHLASSYGHRAVVKVLLDTGRVDVKAVDKYGNTPLDYAVNHRNIGVVLLLRAAETLRVPAD
jgi:ankyrin repeat protein